MHLRQQLANPRLDLFGHDAAAAKCPPALLADKEVRKLDQALLRALDVASGALERSVDGAVLNGGAEGRIGDQALAGGSIDGLARADRRGTAVDVVNRDEGCGLERSQRCIVAAEGCEEDLGVRKLQAR